MEVRRLVCERSAQFVSLDLDGELSHFERAILTRHLRTCERCAADAQAMAELTTWLRTAALEPIPAPIIVSRSRWRVGRMAQSALAAVAVAVVGVWFGLSSGERAPRTVPAGAVIPSSTAGASSSGRYDWPAGLPRSPHMIQLVPGGLRTSSVEY